MPAVSSIPPPVSVCKCHQRRLDSYQNFDIVLHADITEPPVQYTYNLTMYCQLPEAFKEKEKQKEVKEIMKYMLITPDGNVKELSMK